MQVVIFVLCTKGKSLREAIRSDQQITEHALEIVKQQQAGRSPGWLKLRSAEAQRGAINVQWDSATSVLTARVITKLSTSPSAIVGDFINYMFARHRIRVKAITTAVR